MQSLWMLFASFAFSAMGVCVKLASKYYSTSEIVFYRGLIGTLFITCLIIVRGGTLKTTLPWQHLQRGAIGVCSLWIWFFSIDKLPFGTSMTLNYMSSIWMAAMLFVAGWWRGKSHFEWGLTAAIIASFGGVIMLLRPSFEANQWFGGLMGLSAGVLSGIAYLQVRQLGQLGEPEYRVVFYFSATGIVGGLLGVFISPHFSDHAGSWHSHSLRGFLLLLAVGLCATTAQIAMTRAYRLGQVLVTANLQYTGIIFSTLWGIVIWSEVPDTLAWAGMLVIMISGIATTFYHTRTPTKNISPATPVSTLDNIETDPITVEI